MSSLSLLSRGTGQVIRKKQEKLEVHFDPEDYLSWTSPETRRHVSRLLENSQDPEEIWRACLPKTYSTRTGALILYSEDLAKPSRKRKGHKQSRRGDQTKSQMLQVELHTLQDLAQAILAYGTKQMWKSKQGCAWQPYLHFFSDPETQTERQMRPGYSPKRYLLKLSQTWDPTLLQKLLREGYIRDPLLLEESSQDRRKKQQDLSAVPPKYNLLHLCCSPWPCLRVELEEQQTHPGFGPSSLKTLEKRPRLLEECYEGETNPRERTQIPLRIAVRKLSFHFRPQLTKETTWSQDAAYKGIPRDRWAEVHQDRRTRQEHLDHNAKHKQAVDMSRDASELWCEKSHVTFNGGFPPKKSTFCSVAPRRLKNADGKETKPSVDPGFFPPVHTGTQSEGNGVTKKYRKQVPQIFQLPQISEDSPRAPWKKADPTELPKELVVLPLLVRLGKEPQQQPRGEKLKETCCAQSLPKVAASDELRVPLLNNLPFQREQRHRQEICGGLPGAAQDSICLTPIPNGELTRTGRRIRSREAYNPEQVCKHQRESHNGISLSNSIMDPERQTVCPALLGSVQTTDHPGQFGPVPNNEGEDTVLNEEETISRHPPETSAVEELDDKETIQVFAALKNRGSALCAERSLIKRGKVEPEEVFQDLGLLLTQQAGKPPENGKGFGQEPSATGSESLPLQHGKENQQSRGGLCRNSRLQQSKVEKGPSLSTQTARPAPENGIAVAQAVGWLEPSPSLLTFALFVMVWSLCAIILLVLVATDKGKALDNMPLSTELAYMEPTLACPTISEWEMESVPQANHIVMKLLDHSGEFKESLTTGAWSPEKHFGMEDKAALLENASNNAKAAGLSRAPLILENTRATKRTKQRELTAAESVSKARKKRTKKEERKSQVIVPGKPRQKRAAKKTDVHFKEKLEGVEGSETGDEPNEQEGKRQGDAGMEQFDPVVEEERGSGEYIEREGEGGEEVGKDNDSLGSPSVRSHPPSCPTQEAGPLLLEEGRPVAEEEGHYPGSHNSPARETPIVFHLQDFEADGSQTEAGQSSGLPEEDPSAKKEEARRSRERMIAERAEKRRLAVERKRREQEESKRREQEQQERMERMKEEMEREQQRRMEETRLRKQLLEEERQRREEEAEKKRQAEKAAQEHSRQQQEEQRRKILEMQKKKQQEEKERAEAEKRRQKEKELRLEEERRRLAEMAEEERLEYEKKKWEEEEKSRHEAEERRKRHEEAARVALEEARRHALLLARQKVELERQQQFQYKLLVEASGLERRQEISRPWVYSYFQHPYLQVGDDD